MAIQRPLASILAYVIDWGRCHRLGGYGEPLWYQGQKPAPGLLPGAVSDRAFLLTMSWLKPKTDLADKGYWNCVAKTIHTVSVLLVYTAPNQKLVSLHNGLKALKSEKLGPSVTEK